MTNRFGCSTISALVTVAALSAVGAGGYASFTGKSLCSMIHGCPSESKTAVAEAPAKVVPVSAAEDGKACCAMSKLAKAKRIAKMSGDDAKAMWSKTTTVRQRSMNAVVLGATYPVAVPAAFYDNTAAMDDSKLVGAGSCSGAKKSCKSECTSTATMINAAATSEKASGCCSAKKAAMINAAATEKASGCCKAGKAEAAVINAAATEKASGCCKSGKTEAALINAAATEKADSGCCKGSGQRADGKACCGGCKDKAKAAEPIAEKPVQSPANPS